MRDQLPHHWSMSTAYHQAREHLYRRIITDSRLPSDALIVDAGCGDGYFRGPIAEVVMPAASVVAVDSNLAPLRSFKLARTVVGHCLANVERAGLRPGAFDVVWMCRRMHTALDPQRRVDAGAGLQRNTLRTADPQSPEYILRRPGVTCSDPTTVAWGVAP